MNANLINNAYKDQCFAKMATVFHQINDVTGLMTALIIVMNLDARLKSNNHYAVKDLDVCLDHAFQKQPIVMVKK